MPTFFVPNEDLREDEDIFGDNSEDEYESQSESEDEDSDSEFDVMPNPFHECQRSTNFQHNRLSRDWNRLYWGGKRPNQDFQFSKSNLHPEVGA
ncbi:hypothetical protein UCREL1_1025 [Eutypa lata UCREL1]|uniref:Uncharacterized protein n=1 Tax=Eutypa lata (strain UCR-EL1) TaxID=1287681 RepID=M7TPU9_EUTLA|nr:hypothetical protein UCREL1_1025 [Eutypa lata UCREL1]